MIHCHRMKTDRVAKRGQQITNLATGSSNDGMLTL